MKRRTLYFLVILCVLIALGILIMHFGTRSGVTDAQVSESLPGDEIIPNAFAIDRAATLPVPAETAWPWVAQLGSNRGGWYAPIWLENALNKYAASSTIPAFQNLTVGEVIPDYGGGSLKVLDVKPNQYVLYGSVRGSATSTEAASQTSYNFTWLLILENNTPTSTSFHLRLRMPKGSKGIAKYIPGAIPGMIDYATDIVMFAGLQERLR